VCKKKFGYEHMHIVVKGQDAAEVLHWVHIIISNAKAFINGTFQIIKKIKQPPFIWKLLY